MPRAVRSPKLDTRSARAKLAPRAEPGVVAGNDARPGAPDLIRVLSCADILSDSVRRIFTDDSVSEIFAGENQLF